MVLLLRVQFTLFGLLVFEMQEIDHLHLGL